MATNSNARGVMMKQARQLKLKINTKWTNEELAEEIALAQEILKEEQTQEIIDSSDTWVELLLDAFPIEDEKHLVGEVICVPAEMAKRWFQCKVAIPAEKPAEKPE